MSGSLILHWLSNNCFIIFYFIFCFEALITVTMMDRLTDKNACAASNGAPVTTPPELPIGKPSSPIADLGQGEYEQSPNLRPTVSSGVIENKNIVRRKLTGYVGFANLPNQWHRKSVRKGFNFNVMVVGQ